MDPAGFGAYATALAVTALVTLIANGGLAQTVARLITIDRNVIRGLVTFALILGAGGAIILWLTADGWAILWNQPLAAGPIRWLSISTLLAPCLGLASGLMRRLGRFRTLGLLTVGANILGMAAGAVAVAAWESANSLLVSPIAAQIVIFIGCLVGTDRLLFGFGSIKSARNELGFSARVLSTTVLAYLSGNIGKWGASVSLGPAALGQWNRADVISFVPFQQVQTALIQATYPEFRHDRGDAERARRVWPDLLGLVAWVSLPLASVAAVLMPTLIPFLFGEGWEVASLIAIPMCLVGGIQVVAAVLSSGIEAIGRFNWIWPTQAALLLLNITAATLGILYHSWLPILAAPMIGIILQHTMQIVFSARLDYLHLGTLLRHYAGVATASACLAGVTWVLVQLSTAAQLQGWLWVVYSVAVGTAVGLAWFFRASLPPIVIAAKYGIIRSN